MSSRPGGKDLVYDEKLLDVAPEVTRGQRQEGYDADILNPTPPAPVRSPAPQAFNEREDLESGGSNDKHLAAGGYNPVGQPVKQPFWKTPKGLIIIAVVVLVVIAAAVGGGVGGTAGKNKNNNLANNSASSTVMGDGSPHEATSATTTTSTTSGSGGGEVVTRSRSSTPAATATSNVEGEPQETGVTAGSQSTQSIPVTLPTGSVQEGEQLEQSGK